MTVSKYRIIKLLEQNPQGMKARKIASILSAEKKEVNSILYSSPGDFTRDDNYVWRLRSQPNQNGKKYNDTSVTIIRFRETKPNKSFATNRGVAGASPFTVAGVYYHPEEIKKVVGDWKFENDSALRRPAVLQPEPNNVHDKNAIQVMVQDRNGIFHCVGYVPRNQTEKYSAFVDAYAIAEIRNNNNTISITIEIDTNKEKNKLVTQDGVKAKNITTPISTNQNSHNANRRKFSDYLKDTAFILLIVLVFIAPVLPRNYLGGKKTSAKSQMRSSQPTVTKYRLRTYNVTADVKIQSNDHVGNDWEVKNINVNVNGDNKGNQNVVLRPGDVIVLSGCVVEGSEDIPDSSDFVDQNSYTILETDLHDVISKTVYGVHVYENAGQYKYNEAVVNVLFNFSPQD